MPWLPDIEEIADVWARDDMWIARNSGQVAEYFEGRGRELNNLGACFAVRELQSARYEIYIFPAGF